MLATYDSYISVSATMPLRDEGMALAAELPSKPYETPFGVSDTMKVARPLSQWRCNLGRVHVACRYLAAAVLISANDQCLAKRCFVGLFELWKV